MEEVMTINNQSEAAKAVVRRNTEEVQGGGNFDVFDELFADDFLDHTPQPGLTPDKAGARELHRASHVSARSRAGLRPVGDE
jgi:hypothetical protein